MRKLFDLSELRSTESKKKIPHNYRGRPNFQVWVSILADEDGNVIWSAQRLIKKSLSPRIIPWFIFFFNRAAMGQARLRIYPQSRSQSFVPLDQRLESESSRSNHYERTKEITDFWLSGSLRICIYGACLKWLFPDNLVPRAHVSFGQRQDYWRKDTWALGTRLALTALVFRPLVKGKEALGTRLNLHVVNRAE